MIVLLKRITLHLHQTPPPGSDNAVLCDISRFMTAQVSHRDDIAFLLDLYFYLNLLCNLKLVLNIHTKHLNSRKEGNYSTSGKTTDKSDCRKYKAHSSSST